MSQTVTYWENGIKVTKVTNSRGRTTTTYHNRHTSFHRSPSPPKYDDSNDEEKSSDTALRRRFFKVLFERDRVKTRYFYDLGMKNHKHGLKIFGPRESDYALSLSFCYTFKHQKVVSIDEDIFMVCWLMHYSFWKKYPDKPITYIYVTDEERETAHNLGYHDLLSFIERYNIQRSVPTHYFECYSTFLPGCIPNSEVGDNKVILNEYGTKPSMANVTRLKSRSYGSSSTTYSRYSDTMSDKSTEELFKDHQEKLRQSFGTDVDFDISKLS